MASVPAKSPACGSTIWTGRRRRCGCAARSRDARITTRSPAASDRRSCATIRNVRPPRPERTLFLTLKAPIRPLSATAISHVVRGRLDRLGITGKRRGPHALRHAAAQHLLDHGLSMKEVGDYLGHRTVSATSVYAKVQLGTLREVADIDLEGLA